MQNKYQKILRSKYETEWNCFFFSSFVCSQVFICVLACLSIANGGLLGGGHGGYQAQQDNGYNYPAPQPASLPQPAPGNFINVGMKAFCVCVIRTIVELTTKQ